MQWAATSVTNPVNLENFYISKSKTAKASNFPLNFVFVKVKLSRSVARSDAQEPWEPGADRPSMLVFACTQRHKRNLGVLLQMGLNRKGKSHVFY